MGEIKTKPTNQNPEEFLNTIANKRRRDDGFILLDLLKKITGQQPVMWGASIIGFGLYHYKSKRSSQEGDWPLIGFSPRKQSLTLYILVDFIHQKGLLKKLGKHKTSKACLYINKLSDVDLVVLSHILTDSYIEAKKLYASHGKMAGE